MNPRIKIQLYSFLVPIVYALYLFNNLGSSLALSNAVSIWLPILILAIITYLGLLNINEK